MNAEFFQILLFLCIIWLVIIVNYQLEILSFLMIGWNIKTNLNVTTILTFSSMNKVVF